MASPEDTEMKKQWMTVDGRQTPVILPQIWNHDKEEWVVTSEENPLPTQVTGSIVELVEKEILKDEVIKSGARIDGRFTVDKPFRIIFREKEEVDDFYIVVKGIHMAAGAYPYTFLRENGQVKLGYSKGSTGFTKIYTPIERKNDFRVVNASEKDTEVTITVIEYSHAVSNEFTKGLYDGEMKDGDEI